MNAVLSCQGRSLMEECALEELLPDESTAWPCSTPSPELSSLTGSVLSLSLKMPWNGSLWGRLFSVILQGCLSYLLAISGPQSSSLIRERGIAPCLLNRIGEFLCNVPQRGDGSLPSSDFSLH